MQAGQGGGEDEAVGVSHFLLFSLPLFCVVSLLAQDGVGSVAGQRPLLFGCKFRVFMLLLCDNGVTILLRCVFL